MKSFLWGNKSNSSQRKNEQSSSTTQNQGLRFSISEPTNLQHVKNAAGSVGPVETIAEEGSVQSQNNSNMIAGADVPQGKSVSRKTSMDFSSFKRKSGLTRSNRSSTISTYLDTSFDDSVLENEADDSFVEQKQQQQQPMGSTPGTRTNSRRVVSPNPVRTSTKSLRNYSSTESIRRSINLSSIKNSFSSSAISLSTTQQSQQQQQQQQQDISESEAEHTLTTRTTMKNPFIDSSANGAKRKTRSASSISFSSSSSATNTATANAEAGDARGTLPKSKSKYNLSKDTYDQHVFKTGWMNKTQSGLPNYRESKLFYSSQENGAVGGDTTQQQGSNSYVPDYRLYRVSLQGSVLNFYKSGINNVKYFDSNLPFEAEDPLQSENNSMSSGNMRGKENNDNKFNTPMKGADFKMQTSQSGVAHQNRVGSLQDDKTLDTVWPTLKYCDPAGVHPDLMFDTASPTLLVSHDSIEGLVHYILFTKELTTTDVENYVLMLPIVALQSSSVHISHNDKVSTLQNEEGKDANTQAVTHLDSSKHILTALAYLRVFITQFNSVKNQNITYELEQIMLNRTFIILKTIKATLAGVLIDKQCAQLITGILNVLVNSFHTDIDFAAFKAEYMQQKKNMDTLLATFSSFSLPNAKLDLIDPDTFLSMELADFATVIHYINSSFNSVWSPQNDYTLLYEIKTSFSNLNPLMFKNQENVHFLSKLMIQHLHSTMLPNDKDANVNLMAKKRAQLLSKWVQLGCIFEKVGDMVSWLAIATIICSIPILRLSITWKYVPDSILKIIFKDWTPTISQLERKNFSISTSNLFILAPPDMNEQNITSIVPYFGDLMISKDEMGFQNTDTSSPSSLHYKINNKKQNYKYLLKKINRTKNAFSKWTQKSESLKKTFNEKHNSDVSPETFNQKMQDLIQQNPKTQDIFKQVCTFWKLNSMSNQQPLNLVTIMDISLNLEPPLVNESVYSQVGSKRSPLLSGSYLPMIFNDLLPNYSLFSNTALVGASGVKRNQFSEEQPNYIPKSVSTKSVILSGNADVDDSVVDLTQQASSLISNKQRFLKSIRDAFNIEMNDFHIQGDIILKNVFEDAARSSSRPTSMVIETPKRGSTISLTAANGSPYRYSANSSRFSALENMNFFLKNVGSETDKITTENLVQVVLKSCTLDKIFDILVLTTGVFSKFVDDVDVKTYFETLQNKQQTQLNFNKVSSLRNSTTGGKALLQRSSIFAEDLGTPQKSKSRHSSALQFQSRQQEHSFGLLDLPLFTFVMDNNILTETFFNTYKSFTTSTAVLENLAKRFIGAQSCVTSIDKLKDGLLENQESNINITFFPRWDLRKEELKEFDAESWIQVANIQIGVLEAVYYFIKEHYADFTVNVKNHTSILDFLKIVDEELNHDWKYRLKKLNKMDSESSSRSQSPFTANDSMDISSDLSSLDISALEAPVEIRKKSEKSTTSELQEFVDKLQDLYNKVKSSYQRYYFRPLNYNKLQKNILSNLMNFNSISPFDYHTTVKSLGDPMYDSFAAFKHDDYEQMIDWVYKLDDVIIQKLKMVNTNEWLEAGQFLDLFSYSSLVSFFQNDLHLFNWNLINKSKPSSKTALIHENLEISNIFTWLTSLNNTAQNTQNPMSSSLHEPKHILVKFPYSIQMIFKYHHSLTNFFVLQISNPSLSQDERVDIFCKLLQLVLFVRWKNSQVDLFEEDSIDESTDISPHVPSFLETCITEAILTPESRFYEMAWELAYKKLSSKESEFTSIGSLLSDVDRERIVRFVEFDGINKRKNLSPCPGWFIGRLLEISQFVPNMSIENSKLINFDKRRFLNNMVSNFCDMIPEVDEVSLTEESKNFAKLLYTDISKEKMVAYRMRCREVATAESLSAKYTKTGLFNDIINLEIETVTRNQQKFEELGAQEKQSNDIYSRNNRQYTKSISKGPALRPNIIFPAQDNSSNSSNNVLANQPGMSSSSSVLSLSSSLNSTPSNSSSLTSSKMSLRRSSVVVSSKNSKYNMHDPQQHPRSSRIGGFFKRPFSISSFSSSSSTASLSSYLVNNNGTISPGALSLVSIQDIKDLKPQISVKTFDVKTCMPLHSYKHNPHCNNSFKICLNNGTEYYLQATNLEDMHEWMRLIAASKRYSFYSLRYKGKTHNKIFGVPLEDICERENVIIPTIVNRLLEEIELRGLDEVGLYRVPGSVGSINALKQAFDTYGAEGSNNFTLEDDRWFEINAIAGCFKLYLRELPESLFTDEYLEDFIKVMLKFKEDNDQAVMITGLQNLLNKVPVNNYHMMKRLFQHLNKVHLHYENNRMDANNLAIVFSMSFISPDDLGMTVGPKLGALQMILQQLIRNPDVYFS